MSNASETILRMAIAEAFMARNCHQSELTPKAIDRLESILNALFAAIEYSGDVDGPDVVPLSGTPRHRLAILPTTCQINSSAIDLAWLSNELKKYDISCGGGGGGNSNR